MSIRAYACGEPLCKTPFEAELDPDRPWPVKCPSCTRSLYPDDVLTATALDHLDPHRAPLMKVDNGSLSPVFTSDLEDDAVIVSPSLLDEIADASQARAQPPKSRIPTVVVAMVVFAALAIIWAVTRGH